MTVEMIIDALMQKYAERGLSKSLDYAFGFFDAVGVLRDLKEKTNERP